MTAKSPFSIGSDPHGQREHLFARQRTTTQQRRYCDNSMPASMPYALSAVSVLVFQFVLPAAYAARDLDLSSSNKTVTAGAQQSGAITVGGSTVTVSPGMKLTPAESVALSQVLGGGTQSLVLDAMGVATGGQFTLSGRNVTNLVIPTGVTAVRNFGQSGVLNITGNLVNSGNFFAVSNNNQVMSAVISAQNINNMQGGLLTSMLPQGGISGFSNLINNLSLSLNAVQNISNFGVISSAANLNLNAGGSVINALPTGMSGPSPLMQAMSNVNIVSAAVQNAGMVNAMAGNINVASQVAQNLTINNTGGVLQALNGNINIRDQFFTDKFDTSLIGGDWISQQLNVFSGDGHINVDVHSILGQTNLIGGTAALSAQTGDLHVGALKMSGDPTISSGGDVFLEMSQFGGEWIFSGLDALIINAGGNIINKDVSYIGTSANSGATGSVILNAGGMIDLQTVPIIAITTATSGASSGNISLTANGPILLSGSLITSTTGAQSGDVSINSNAGSIISSGPLTINTSALGGNAGSVSLSSAAAITMQNGVTINTSSDTGNAGSINVVAQAGDINLGGTGNASINASSIAANGGTLTIQAMAGSLFVGNGSMDLSSKNGTGGGISAFVNGGSVLFGKSAIEASGLFGGSISFLTTYGVADIDLSKVDIKANGATGGAGGSVNLTAGLFGVDMVESDKVSLGSAEITGASGSSSTVALSTSKSDVEVGSITANGASVVINSAAGVSVNSIIDSNPLGQGGTVSISSYVNAQPTDGTPALGINTGGGQNSVGFISVDGGIGGTIFASNHGTGGINAGSIVINSNTGNGGTILLVSDGALVLSGTQYSANGGSSGEGGQVNFSSSTGITGGDILVSAAGGGNNSGGTLSMSSPQIQVGSLTADTSGHGIASAGFVSIGGTNSVVDAKSMNITSNGGGASSVELVGSLHIDDLTITTKGGDFAGKKGGTINLVFADGIHGALNLNAAGADSAPGGTIELHSLTDLVLASGQAKLSARSGSQGGDGGTIILISDGSMSIDADVVDVSSAAKNGSGGSINIDTGLNASASSSSLKVNGTLRADGVGTGNGGTITVNVRSTSSSAGDLAIGNGSGFNLSARGGSAGGNGGAVIITAAGDLSVAGSGIDVGVSVDGDGGKVSLTAGGSAPGQLASANHSLNLSGVLSANSAGSGKGGQIDLMAPQLNLADGSVLVASSTGTGNGGSVSLAAGGNNADLQIGKGSQIDVSSQGGDGGSVLLSASRNVTLNSATINSSSASANGGTISVDAGSSQGGVIDITDANVIADGAQNGGSISLTQNSSLSMNIGHSNAGVEGTGTISASGANGGKLSLSSGANDLLVAMNQKVNLSGSSDQNMGAINANSPSNVSISGLGDVVGNFNGSAKNYSVVLDGAVSKLGAQNISTSAGNITLKASTAVYVAAGASLNASQGAIELGAPSIHFLGNANLAMNNAGLLKLNSGTQSGSLSLDFADGSTVTFSISQGNSVRPGVLQIEPSGTGSLSLNTSGNADLVVSGATVSMGTSNGAINLGSGVNIDSDAFDTSTNIGVEIIANGGDVNINSPISAKQLNVSTVGNGSINLGADISSPTVVLSVQGKGNINQVGSSTTGIGTLVLNSQSGNIGSKSAPIEANVLELQVNSGGSVYINNASQMDLRTSTIAGTFELNNDGDLAIEANLNAGTLNLSANGNISMFSSVSGNNGVNLASNGGGTNIQIGLGNQLSSSSGNITLHTDNLILDGSIQISAAGAQLLVDSSAILNLSGSNGNVLASGANSAVTFAGSNGVNFNTSYVVNAGATGSLTVQTASLSSSGVNLGSSVSLTAAGGTKLNISTNALNFGSGSSITATNDTQALVVQSSLGAPLTITATGSSSNNIIASAGGDVSFASGTGAPLVFTSSGLGIANLSVQGGRLITTSSAADTSLASLNLSSDRNIQINVNGGTLHLDGNITSSQSNGVIVLQDPLGITIAGAGTVGFSSGLSGTINVLALNVGDSISVSGTPHFNAGVNGEVNFQSNGSINLLDGASILIDSANSVSFTAPLLNFGSNSAITAKGSSINFVGLPNLGITFGLPAGAASVSTSGGSAITISAPDAAPINFVQNNAGAGQSTLNFAGAPVTISTSNANVTIASSVVLHSDNTVSVLTPGGTLVNNGLIDNPNAGSQTIIEASGDLLINQNVNANSLIIRTLANNGTITLAADVIVINDLLVSAIGSGNIRQTAGILKAASITLMSGSGDIGSSKNAIHTETQTLSVSTAAEAHISNKGAVTVSSYSVGEGLSLKATGDISIGTSGKALVLTSNGTFNAGANGKVIVDVPSLTLSNGVRLRVDDSSLTVNAGTISMGNNSRLRADGDLSVSGNIAGKNYKFTSREGNLQVSGSLSGTEVVLRTKDDGNIVLNGNFVADCLEINADGRGNISQQGGLITANNLVLRSDRGNIGSSTLALAVKAENLRASTWGNGLVNIAVTGNVNLDDSSAGGSFTVKSSGALNVQNVETRNGSIYLQSQGDLNVAKNSELVARQGNLTLQNANESSGVIKIGKNVSLIALSDSQSNGLGNVRVVVGAIPTNPIRGSIPSNTSVSEKWGGKAYFGANGITVNGKNNELDAWGANIVFSTGSRDKSAIVLSGGVYILADPPPAPTGILSSQAISAPAPSATVGTTVAMPVLFNASSSNLRTDISAVRSLFKKLEEQTVNASAVEASNSNPKEFTPIACVSSSPLTVQGKVEVDVESIQKSASEHGSVYARACKLERHSSDRLHFISGEMILDSHKLSKVECAVGEVQISGDGVALLKSDGTELELFNLCESRWGAVKVKVGDREFVVGAGQRLLIGSKSSVAVRKETVEKNASGINAKLAEYSLLSLMSSSHLLNDVIHSSEAAEKHLGARLLKMAACLQLVTSSHGVFKN